MITAVTVHMTITDVIIMRLLPHRSTYPALVFFSVLDALNSAGTDALCCKLTKYLKKKKFSCLRASTPSNIASNIAGNSFYLNSGFLGRNIAGN